MSASPSLNAARRAAELDRLADGERIEVLVIGGGITGAGVALDAASRGLSVALLERDDLAFGTSRWSSKLVHGGLRYLAHGDFGLAWESARERGLLMRTIAPHLVRPLPFLVPLGPIVSPRDGAMVELGARIGNALRLASRTGRRTLPSPRRLGALEAQRLIPALCAEDLRGAIVYWDGQLEDDARLVIATARTAAAHGARILPYCSALAITAQGARARDELSGESFEIRAGHVVNATGVWAGELEPAAKLTPSKGAHVIVPAVLLGDPRAALTVAVEDEPGRWVFALPTRDQRVTIGVTDDPYDQISREAPPVDGVDIGRLIDTLNRALVTPLQPADVIGSFAGLRPLVSGEDGPTADLSRRHAVIENPDSGTLTVVGGKLTTYRSMAEEVVDRIAARRGVAAGACRTARLPLIGAAPAAALRRIDAPQRLIDRYGTEARALVDLATGRPELLAPVADGPPDLRVELSFAVEHELALTPEDLVDRRTRIGLIQADRPAAIQAAQTLLEPLETVA